MAQELEYKLGVKDEAQLDKILGDPMIAGLRAQPWQETEMKTVYFDTSDRYLGQKKWMLRHRQEGRRSVICVKTPGTGENLRNEWEILAAVPDKATLEALAAMGGPEELLQLSALEPVCGAEFLRRHVLLEFTDGSKAELAVDTGVLYGPQERLPFAELELELKEGQPDMTRQLVQTLCQRYGLKEEPRSKAARANSLK